jgi:hypothetical protein
MTLSFVRAALIIIAAPFVLWLVHRAIWWNRCIYRSIRLRSDSERIVREHKNPFFVPAKIIPLIIAVFGIVLIAVDDSISGLAIFTIAFVWYSVISMVYAFRVLPPD